MRLEVNNSTTVQSLYNQCKQMMSYHVILKMKDGSEVDGIIESVEPDKVNVLVGEDVMVGGSGNEYSAQRQYGNPTRYRRFNRRNYLLANLLALTLLPYPYYAPPYPYYAPSYPYSPY